MEEFHPGTEKEALAREIADLLNDSKGLKYYLKITRRYPEPYLRKVLEHVLAIPEDRLWKSRGALFNWMLSRYGTDKGNQDS